MLRDKTRVDIVVPSRNSGDQLRFYVDELRLFEIHMDYGMGAYLLRHVEMPQICLQLLPWEKRFPEYPLFCLSTSDCQAEWERLRQVRFSCGGIVQPAGGGSEIIEYPLGKTFGLRDASGNLFEIAEWHPNAI